jgi:3-dehydroquinate synthase
MTTTTVIRSRLRDYSVTVSDSFGVIQALKEDPLTVFLVDEVVRDRFPALWEGLSNSRLRSVAPTEETKTLRGAEEIFRFLLGLDIRRRLRLVSVGGGIVQDVSGFVASTLYRGVHWTFIPTTLLAQADSCIGGKTSLNLMNSKNVLGNFYPPHDIHVCTDFLTTLRPVEIDSGIGEIVKFQLLSEAPSLDLIESLVSEVRSGRAGRAIAATHSVKKDYIESDEFDHGRRNLLNYGHCFGHALESTSEHRIPHGVAVTIGMVLANTVSLHRGLLSEERFDELNRRVLVPNLSVRPIPDELDPARLAFEMGRDKKRSSRSLTAILLQNDGLQARKFDDLTLHDISACVADFISAGFVA